LVMGTASLAGFCDTAEGGAAVIVSSDQRGTIDARNDAVTATIRSDFNYVAVVGDQNQDGYDDLAFGGVGPVGGDFTSRIDVVLGPLVGDVDTTRDAERSILGTADIITHELLAVPDLDGDGRAELTAATGFGSPPVPELYLIWGEPTGTTTIEQAAFRWTATDPLGFNMRLAVGDLDGEAGLDLVFSDASYQVESGGGGVTWVLPGGSL
ncbi:MAG: hypothetical protein ABMB14_30515, partial [Myxococcota bacterium]